MAGDDETTDACPGDDRSMAARFRALHERDQLLVCPNPFDVGSARLLEHLGFEALATTSAGLARGLGRADAAGAVSRDEAVAHAASMVAIVGVPVTGDLEDGFSIEPEGVVETIEAARAAGLAGCCIEDATYDRSEPIMDIGLATARIEAAVEAARRDGHSFVLTARADNILYGWRDVDEAISRLQAYGDAGADVLYAPAVVDLTDIGRLVGSVDRPVNVLIGLPGQEWTLDDLEALGVRRVTTGGGLPRAAYGSVMEVARSLVDDRRMNPVGGALPDLDQLFSG